MKEKVPAYVMPRVLAQGIIDYLADKPFKEVEAFINGMRQMTETELEVEMPGPVKVAEVKGNGADPDPPEAPSG